MNAARETLSHAERIDSSAETPLPLRILFVVSVFPAISETFIIDQVAGLRDRGADVVVASFNEGDLGAVSQKYFDYAMGDSCLSLEFPSPILARIIQSLPIVLTLAVRRPMVLARALNVFRYGRRALSLELVYRAHALAIAARKFDIIHCHFGTVAREFVAVRDVLGLRTPMVTSFYGFDVSKVFRERDSAYYDDLKAACSMYLVMSEDMKQRVVAHGFRHDEVVVHPVSIEVDVYPFSVRSVAEDEPLRIVAVGRFVEKKGFDDLLHALASVNDAAPGRVVCTIVGGGPLERELRQLTEALGLTEVVTFAGFLPVDDVLALLSEGHVLVQPSKTARDGDME